MEKKKDACAHAAPLKRVGNEGAGDPPQQDSVWQELPKLNMHVPPHGSP